MKKRIIAFILIAPFFALHLFAQNFKVVGYVQNWNAGVLNNITNNFPFHKITHINIAFKNPSNYTTGTFAAMSAAENGLIAKCHEKNVKILVAIGGAGSANLPLKKYYDTLTTPERASDFASYIRTYCQTNNLDGVDVDLESAAITANKVNYNSFVRILADTMHKYNLLCTAAISEGYGGADIYNSTLPYFDFINIMAYDAKGPWNPNDVGQHSSMAFAQSNVLYWKSKGVPKEKCILGVPFYGYGFNDRFRNNGYTYSELIGLYGGETVAWSDEVSTVIYYNGANTIYDKTEYAKDNAGGIMIWEISQDVFTNLDYSLMEMIYQSTGPLNVENMEVASFSSIYPNPAKEFMNISITHNQKYTCQLFDMKGQLLMTLENPKNIPVEALNKGVYVLKILSEKGTNTKKIIVE